MADEEFEIDIYGDAGGDQTDSKADSTISAAFEPNHNIDLSAGNGDYAENKDNLVVPPAKPPQGVKRKSEADDRPIDPGATTALLVSDLNWWNTDDDIRGWCREAHCENELKDITFSEHKVNGKSKGQAYVEFYSQAAATAAKHCIDSLAENSSQPGQKRHAVIYTSPSSNPFRTLPKDAPARKQDSGSRAPSGPGFTNDNPSRGNFGGGFNRGNSFRGRGGMANPGYNNRNFSGGNMGGFGGGNMGFNNSMGGGGFGFGSRGNMMGGGMRGGPGGMRGRGGGGGGGGGMNMMGGMGPMGGMGMGGMPGGMGGMGGMGMGMGFQGMNPGPFGNPGFFGGGNQSGGNEWQNPHGAKRQRPE